jgi:hypothetical protein
MNKEITYKLQNTIQYARAGEMQNGEFIQLSAPTSKNIVECAFLKQAFYRALPKDVEEEPDAKPSEINGEGVMTLLMMSNDVELSKILLSARDLFTSGVAMLDGEQKLTKPLIDLMAQEDLEAMTGEYLANFLLASVLQKQKKS